jgi:hypothetical protein
MVARTVALLLGGVITGACFQSDFVLYGPVCAPGPDRDDCADVVGERGDRLCFSPEADAEVGYCSVKCDLADPGSCAPRNGLSPRCIGWENQDGEVAGVCTLVCGEGVECPDGMRCEPHAAGGDSSLCIP